MKLEIYFDYLCEFCEIGWRYWRELLPAYPQITPVWRPCEAHPRASEPRYGRHSDLAIQGLLFLQGQGGDAAKYNDLIFSAAWRKGENIEDLALLSRYGARCGAEEAAFCEAVRSGRYQAALEEANRRAWDILGLPAVPSYLAENGRRVDASLGIGVSKTQLKQFLEALSRADGD
ncbi:DsbA family protein [Clostridium sp. D33t1_170424_F3]|uniref:DsbA family oxidoreductase n=1 Tax=Clostridium sp. D33t1_170424_F3 TaxID=2787099 RepID=UPI0018AAA387|nr:DsbA family protein [Clostridium sp. D33t1_170424_F3]